MKVLFTVFLLILISGFLFIQSYAIEESSENVTVKFLDEKGNVIAMWNGSAISLKLSEIGHGTDSFTIDLDDVLEDYEHKEILKSSILGFILEEQGVIFSEEQIEPSEERPFPEQEQEFMIDIERAAIMGIIETNCIWHLTQHEGKFLNFTKPEQLYSLISFTDCAEEQIKAKLKDELVLQIIEAESEQSRKTTSSSINVSKTEIIDTIEKSQTDFSLKDVIIIVVGIAAGVVIAIVSYYKIKIT